MSNSIKGNTGTKGERKARTASLDQRLLRVETPACIQTFDSTKTRMSQHSQSLNGQIHCNLNKCMTPHLHILCTLFIYNIYILPFCQDGFVAENMHAVGIGKPGYHHRQQVCKPLFLFYAQSVQWHLCLWLKWLSLKPSSYICWLQLQTNTKGVRTGYENPTCSPELIGGRVGLKKQ